MWAAPLKWDRAAAASGKRRRVFVNSLADFFEDYQGPDAEAVAAARQRACQLMEQTTNLDWLLLTKRPQNVPHMVPRAWQPWQGGWPKNIWMGTTAGTQQTADQRLPHLLILPAPVLFVSCEPALEHVNFRPWMRGYDGAENCHCLTRPRCFQHDPRRLGWLIIGGESGPGARPFDLEWARSAVRQCSEAGVPAFVKQVGAKPFDSLLGFVPPFSDAKGGIPAEWPQELRVQQFPAP